MHIGRTMRYIEGGWPHDKIAFFQPDQKQTFFVLLTKMIYKFLILYFDLFYFCLILAHGYQKRAVKLVYVPFLEMSPHIHVYPWSFLHLDFVWRKLCVWNFIFYFAESSRFTQEYTSPSPQVSIGTNPNDV